MHGRIFASLAYWVAQSPGTELSSDPETAYTLIAAYTTVTIFIAHLCLGAPSKIAELQRIRFWPSSMRRNVKNWLPTLGLYAGVPEFILWDLVPAVYLLVGRLARR